jgi:hypothetical protein
MILTISSRRLDAIHSLVSTDFPDVDRDAVRETVFAAAEEAGIVWIARGDVEEIADRASLRVWCERWMR